MLPFGAYVHRVTLTKPGPVVPDGEGGYTQAPVALEPPTWPVSITPATARDLERVVANTVQARASHIVRGPYRADISTATTLTFKGRTFQVTGLQNPEERNRELVLACEELVT